MKRRITSSSSVLLGFSAGIGALLAVSVVAFANTGTAGRATAAPGAVDPTTLLDTFQRPRTEQDSLPTDIEARLRSVSASAPSEALAPGDPVASRSRRVTHPDGTTFFLTPTSRKQLCIAVVPSGDLGCTVGAGLADVGVEFQLVDGDGLNRGDPTVVQGIVATGVTGLEVAYAGGSHNASLVEGTFSLATAEAPTAVTVRMSDGSERLLPIPAPPQP